MSSTPGSGLTTAAEAKAFRDQADYYFTLLMGVTWVEASLAVGIFTCQTITSWRYTKRFRADYWVSAFALLMSFCGQCILTYSSHSSRAFGHTLFVPYLERAFKWGWMAIFISIVATTVGKISIVSFLVQVRGRHQSKPWFLWFIIVSNVIVDIISICFLLTECHPTSKLWRFSEPGTCTNTQANKAFAYLQGIWSALTDIMLALYPIAIVYNLHIHIRTKIGLCILMGFGVLAGACAAIKTSQLHVLNNTSGISYNVAPLIVSAITEQWITLIVACVPPSRPLLKRFLDKMRDVTHKLRGTSAKERPPPKLTPFMDIFAAAAAGRKQMGTFSAAYHEEKSELDGESSDDNSAYRNRTDAPNHPYPPAIFLTTNVTVEYEDDLPPRNNSDSSDATIYDRNMAAFNRV